MIHVRKKRCKEIADILKEKISENEDINITRDMALEIIDLLKESSKPTEDSCSRKLPCICGAHYGKLHIGSSFYAATKSELCRGYFIYCSNCGKISPTHKTKVGAIRNWNNMIKCEKESE